MSIHYDNIKLLDLKAVNLEYTLYLPSLDNYSEKVYPIDIAGLERRQRRKGGKNMSLVGEERKRYILKVLDEKGKVKVNDLAKELNVSTETIRQYLEQMDKKNLLKKVYGGAIKVSTDRIEPSQYIRENVNSEEKRKIGKAAADLVQDNEVIIVDEGSTTLQMIKYLSKKKDITLVTNSVAALTLLIDFEMKGLFHGKINFIGGEVDSKNLRVSGLIAEQFIQNFYADKLFLSTEGVTKDHGFTSYNSNKALLSRKFMDCAKETIVLVDHSKFGARRYYKIADIKEVDKIISDQLPPHDWEGILAEKNVEWIVGKEA
ncbi:DeoR/GlpR family DNA-binding transcription regulator [Scopulibacillus cellulosilyticus]|uniref:DeoR/GlpR family DNA-binding transcription regulator n=1 Tax=Scopulibacillus cellulosilyticus TaxID=2665665 RepID=A0ABW2PTH3_9BACL